MSYLKKKVFNKCLSLCKKKLISFGGWIEVWKGVEAGLRDWLAQSQKEILASVYKAFFIETFTIDITQKRRNF
jgi:hypothetical protein